MDENKNKKAQILFKKEKQKRIISQEKRNNSKENLTSGITNNTSNNTYLNSNSSSGIRIIKTKFKKEQENVKNNSPRIPNSGPIKKKLNEIPNRKMDKKQKNYRKEKLQKLELMNDNNNKVLKKNKSFNYKKPKCISTDNNIFNCETKKKEDINKNKINIPNNNKIKYNNYLHDNDNNNKHTIKQNISYTKINKNKTNPVNTYENNKKNNPSLIRNKTNENYNKSKENKSNMSNYDKRKNYNVPKVKAKPRTIEKEEKEDLNIQNEEDDENEKEKNISKLLQNQEASYIKEIKKLMEEGTQSKKTKEFELKRKVIEQNGIDFENLYADNDEEEEKEENENLEEIEEIEKAKNKNKEKKNKDIKNNKNITLEINNNNMRKNEKIYNKSKEKNENDEDINNNNENKNKMNKDKLKANINKNNNKINIQNNSNIKNSNSNYLMLQNENINMNLSGSLEKNNNNDTNNNNIISKYNQYNIIRPNNYYYEDRNDQLYEKFNNKKEKRKQNVNTFEYLENIMKEIKEKKKDEYYDENVANNDSLGESFRKSIHSNKNDDIKNNNRNAKKKSSNQKYSINKKEENISEAEADSGFNYDDKKNTRSKMEIQEYMEKQKKKNKFEEEKNLKNNQAKNLNKYLGLYKLQEGINLSVSKNRSKIYSTGNTNIQNKKEVNENKNNNREKIPNEFYFGKQNILKRKNSDLSRSTESSQSTIIDQNNYYINLIESKNILSSNYFNQNLLNENLIQENNNNKDINNNNNINIVSTDNSNNIRNSTKDKDIQNTYNINTNTSNNKLSQEMNEKVNNNMKENKNNNKINGDIFVKCKETLEKANQLFSKPNIEEYINNYRASYNEKNSEQLNNNIYNNENMGEENNEYNEDNNEDNEENNQIINTQINKSESKTNKSVNEVNEEIYQNKEENNKLNIQENIFKKMNDNNVNNNKNILNNNFNIKGNMQQNQIIDLNNNINININKNVNNNINNNINKNVNNNININNNEESNQIEVLNQNNYNVNYNNIQQNQNKDLNNKNEDIIPNAQKEKQDKRKEKENENKKENDVDIRKKININDKSNKDIKDILEGKKGYFFSKEDLENYYKIFVSLDDYLNSLTKKNALNDIISYGDLKYTYKIGFEHIILLIKSYPFNLLRLIYQRQYYKDVLRQFFVPYLRRAFNNINIYIYNKQRFSEVNKVIEQIYRIVFIKRLNFYGQIKQLYKIENEFIQNETKEEKQQISSNKNIVINTDNINNNENNNKDNKKENVIKIDNEKMDLLIRILELIYKKIVFTKLYSYCMNLESINKKNENDISDKSNISSQRYNTYIYESFSEKSSLTAYPNSEGSARLHKVCELLEMQRKPQLEEENNNLSELANDSIPSIKSLDDDKYKKRNISIDSNNKLNKNNNLIDKKQEEKKLKENLIKIDENINKQNEIQKNEEKKIEPKNNINDENNINIKEIKEIVEEDGLNIPYKEIINNLNKNKEKLINNNVINNEKEEVSNIKNKEDNENIDKLFENKEIKEEKKELDNNNNNKGDIKNDDNKINNDKIYENLPRKIENEQYKKIDIINDNTKNNNTNSNKYTGCVKKIEISNNLKLNRNSQPTLEDISASKESNLIEWEFNSTNNNKSSNRDKSPLVNDLLNSKKDDLLNSSEFNSNIKEGVIEENDINITNENEKIDENVKNNENNNKDIVDLNEKKSRNNINEIKNDIKDMNINLNNDIKEININNEKNEKNEINVKNEKNEKNENNNNNIQINNPSDIPKPLEDNKYQINLNLNNSVKSNNNPNLNKETNINNIPNNNNLRYNENTEAGEANTNKENLNGKNINILNVEDQKKNQVFSKLSEDNIQKLSNDLCEEIILNLLSTEIKDKKKSLFKKKKEINASLNNSSASLIVSQNSLSIGSHSPGRNYPPNKNMNLVNNNDSYQTISSVNNSQSEAILNNSIFMRTLDEIKKEKTLNLYNDKIAPLLVNKIEENIDKNYDNIINNLKIPLKIDEAKMINGLMLKDRSLSSSSKIRFCNENITKVKFVEEKILNDFDKIDKEIRSNDNIINDNYYDKILNKCVYDTTNELIEKQRQYGIIGEPLFWSIRTKDIDYKYKNGDKYSKSIFINKIIKEMKKIIDTKMGLIAENYEYLDMDQLNQDRDKKFMESITNELKDNEDYYQIFETQETYVKLSLSRIIMDQLLNEIVEILEHVQYSRKEPDKYQSKSIYACEDIPRLSFQPQTMENNYSGNLEGDGEGDESINQ